jgi:hypothetical protein
MSDTHEPAQPKEKPRSGPVPRTPPPVTVLRGISPPPRPTVRAGAFKYEFPEDLAQSARDRVTAKRLEGAQILRERQNSIRSQEDAEGAIVSFIVHALTTLCDELSKLGMSLQNIDEQCREFLRQEAIYTGSASDTNLTTESGRIQSDVWAKIERSAEWSTYERLMREAGAAPAGSDGGSRQGMQGESTQQASTASGWINEQPLQTNPFPESDARYSALAPYFESITLFRHFADEYPDLFDTWKAGSAAWIEFPGLDVVNFKEFTGSAYHAGTSVLGAATRLLPPTESWFNPGRDPWLNIADSEPGQALFYALREFWLKAKEKAELADADMKEFAKTAADVGYWPHGSPHAIGARVWHKMVNSKKPLRESLQELELTSWNDIGACEEAAGWIQDGRIKHLFRACAYFVGVLAARRATELQKQPAVLWPPVIPSWHGRVRPLPARRGNLQVAVQRHNLPGKGCAVVLKRYRTKRRRRRRC